jgi:hypothetical protein
MSKTGFVYKLVCNDVEIKECYVGSTNNERVRKNQHKNSCNNEKNQRYNLYVYQFIRENGGFQNWDMVRLDEFKYNERQQLHTRERYWIEQLQSSLNKSIPTRTKTEYYQDNKDNIAEKNKELYVKNKEEILQKNNGWRQKNKEQLSIQRKEHYQKNREQLLENRKIQITCECGSIYTKYHKARHEKSKKHKDYSTNHIIATENERNE